MEVRKGQIDAAVAYTYDRLSRDPVDFIIIQDEMEKAREIAAGIRKVIAAELDEFGTDYPCHSPEEKRWCYVRATRLEDTGPVRVVVSHEDVTPIKLVEETLREREFELELQKQNLEEANTALRVLLKRREEDKGEL